jgi:hypothetical protein
MKNTAFTSFSAQKRRRAITVLKKKLFVINGLPHLLSREIIRSFEHGSSKRIIILYLNPPFLRYYPIDINALISLQQLNLQTEKKTDH